MIARAPSRLHRVFRSFGFLVGLAIIVAIEFALRIDNLIAMQAFEVGSRLQLLYSRAVNYPSQRSSQTLTVKVDIKDVEILHLESIPPKFDMAIYGHLPDSCVYNIVVKKARYRENFYLTLLGERPAHLSYSPTSQPVQHRVRVEGH